MRRLLQGPALLMAGALLACAGGGRSGPSATADLPDWVRTPPEHCATGLSGPTLDPGHAIRQSRRDALESLAATRLGAQIESDLLIDQGGVVAEYTEERILGVLRDAQIVAMVADPATRVGAAHASSALYALACQNGAVPEDLPSPDYPAWLLSVPERAGRLCVHAIGGPTREPAEQRNAALRDGRTALAATLESTIERRVIDDGRTLARVFSRSESTEAARERAAAVESLDLEWLDAEGRGPLGLPGVLYGVVCSPP